MSSSRCLTNCVHTVAYYGAKNGYLTVERWAIYRYRMAEICVGWESGGVKWRAFLFKRYEILDRLYT